MRTEKENSENNSHLYKPFFPGTWKTSSLYVLATWLNGMAFRDFQFSDKGKPIIKIAEIKNGVTEQTKFTQADYDKAYYIEKGDMLFAWSGQPETSIDVYWWRDEPGWLNQHIFKINPLSLCDPIFFFYLLKYLKPHFIAIARNKQTIGLGHVTVQDLKNLIVKIPDMNTQRAIAGILGALDDKIELNRRMNRTLEEMARAVFRHWFVENEEVEGWEVGTLGDVVVNFDSKRIPLSKREREKRQGKYPYYGAASVMDYVDDYLFDGIFVLLAEDGSVVGDCDNPVLQYVWGKFWVNNHAHVLQGTSGISNEHVYLFLKGINIIPYVTGAVQPKLNQANMNSIPFVIPPKDLSKKFEDCVSPLFAKIRTNEEETRTLAELRDTLLPKLMRGEVRVKDVEVKLTK